VVFAAEGMGKSRSPHDSNMTENPLGERFVAID
jgi:hypothetical protein